MSSWVPWDDARTIIKNSGAVTLDKIHWPNEPFDPPSPPDIWISVDTYSPNLDLIDIGGNNFCEAGTIQITCIAPAGTGTDALRVVAQTISDAFKGLGPRNPFYLNGSIGEGATSEDGQYYAMVVSIDFKYESHLS